MAQALLAGESLRIHPADPSQFGNPDQILGGQIADPYTSANRENVVLAQACKPYWSLHNVRLLLVRADWTLHGKYCAELGIAVVSLSHIPQCSYPAARGLTPTGGVEIQPHARENLSGVSLKLRSLLVLQRFTAFRFMHVPPYT